MTAAFNAKSRPAFAYVTTYRPKGIRWATIDPPCAYPSWRAEVEPWFRQAQQRALNGDTNGALYDALVGLVRLTETLVRDIATLWRPGSSSRTGPTPPR